MNSLTRMPQQQITDPASGWWWDGQQWVCSDCTPTPCPPGPPPFFPPPQGQPPWYPGANGGVSFSTTAPPNPIRGAFWWDGVTLRMFDGAAWVGVGGAASGGTPPSTTAPSNPTPGQQWFNGTTLYVWDGNAWVPVSQTKTSIQATAPPAPNPGDLWYDGTQLHIWDGSAWELVGPGATVGPVATTQQVLAITPSGNIALGSSTSWIIVPFTTVPQIDTQTGWDATTKRYMPKKAGNYLFFVRQYYGSDMTLGGHCLVKNDSGAFNAQAQANVMLDVIGGPASTIGDYLTTSGMVHMNGTTDFVRLWGYSSDGTFIPISTNMPLLEAWLFP